VHIDSSCDPTSQSDTILSMERRSVVEYLENFLRRGGECAYVQHRGYRTVRWSYRQVAQAAFQFARELQKRSIGKGDRVLLWGPNSAEWVSAFFGCALRGVIVVPIDNAGAADFTHRVCQQVEAKLLLCSCEHAQFFNSTSTPILILEDLQEALSSHSPAAYDAAGISAADTLEVVFTSGTTAEPKGVVISHGNVLGNIGPLETEIQRYLKYERLVHPVRFLNLLPLSHVFGQFLGIFLPQLLGGTVIFQDALKPAEVIRTIRRERVSLLVAVPRILQSLKEKIERDLEEQNGLEEFRERFQTAEGKHFLRRWWIFRRVHRQLGWKFWAFICGGAALDRVTEEFWGRMGYAVIQGYGLTETTSIISVNHPFRLGKGSIGKVLAGREVKLAPDGEILVRGSGVAAGYWTGQELQPMAGEQGWYGTGDIGELDSAGNLYFKGRKKDVIVTPAGMNVYPEDLEAALRRQPEVRDCAVIALPRDGNAEPCAVVILRDRNVDLKPVIGRANETLAEYQRIRNWLVWPDEDFPRTSTQKPRGNVIQQVVLSRLGNEPAGRASSSPLVELIGRVTGRPAAQSGQEANLETDLNLSSLARVELMGAIEDRYQVDLSETGFAAVKTVGDLEGMLHGKLPLHVKYHYPRWVQRWPMTWNRLIIHYLLLRPAVFLLGWPRIVGRENLRGVRGPVLVVCNHIDDVDVGHVLTALPARLRHRLATATGGEALEALRTPPLGRSLPSRTYDRLKWFLGVSLLNLFPLPRQAGFRESFAYAGESVDRGYSILVFPEGRHTTDGKIHPFRAGVGLLANNLAIPVVPMQISGLFELKEAGKKFARPWQIQVKIGLPVQFPRDSDPEWIAGELQKKVEQL
jgi:long-chain acyl-CoA synthetase